MQYEVLRFEKTYGARYKATVLCKPNWFMSLFVRQHLVFYEGYDTVWFNENFDLITNRKVVLMLHKLYLDADTKEWAAKWSPILAEWIKRILNK